MLKNVCLLFAICCGGVAFGIDIPAELSPLLGNPPSVEVQEKEPLFEILNASKGLDKPGEAEGKISLSEAVTSVKVFDPTPITSIKITDPREIFANQPLWAAFGFDGALASAFFSLLFPPFGDNCSALEKGVGIGIFAFQNPDGTSFPCIVFQVAKGNTTCKPALQQQGISSFDCEGYTLIAPTQASLDLIVKEKSLPGILVAQTKEPLTDGQLKLSIPWPLQRLAQVYSIDAIWNTLGLQKLEVALDADAQGIMLHKIVHWDPSSPISAHLKSWNAITNFGFGGIEGKDAYGISLVNDIKPVLNAMTSLMDLNGLNDLGKALTAPKDILSGSILFLFKSYQEKDVFLRVFEVAPQVTIESYLAMVKSTIESFWGINKSYLPTLLSNTSNLPSVAVKSDFHCDHNGQKIYACVITENNAVEQKNLLAMDAMKSPAALVATEQKILCTDYVALYNGQAIESDSLDYLKLVIDDMVAKKIPVVSVTTALGDCPKGMVGKMKLDLGKWAERLKKEPELPSLPDEYKSLFQNFLSSGKNYGSIGGTLIVKDGQSQCDLSVSLEGLQAFFSFCQSALETLGTGLQKVKEEPAKIEEVVVPTQPSTPTPVAPVQTSYNFRAEDIFFQADRQIIIPVKILTDCKVRA